MSEKRGTRLAVERTEPLPCMQYARERRTRLFSPLIYRLSTVKLVNGSWHKLL